MSTTALAAHPAADLFPLLSDPELRELAKDIRENGLLEPIVLHEEQVLDGRNRLAACEIAKVEPRFVDWNGDGGTPLRYALSHNLHRRHLTTSQRAAIAAEILPQFEEEARKRQGSHGAAPGRPAQNTVGQKTQSVEGTKLPSGPVVRARDEAAAMLNVSPASVERAKRVKATSPEEFGKLRAGEKTVNAALRDSGLRDTRPRPEIESGSPVEPLAGRAPRRSHERRVADFTRATTAAHATCTALANVGVPADLPDEIKQRAIGELREAVNAVNRFRRQIEES